MRLMFCWASATTFPTVMVITAMPHMSIGQSSGAPRSAVSSTRRRAAKAAALEPVAMNAVIEVGAPSYASGAHMWNGTEEILKPKPTSRRPKPMTSIGSRPAPAATAFAMRSRLVVPVAPKMSAMP